MKYLLILILLSFIYCESVQISTICKCSQIKSETDCLKMACQWTNSACADRSLETYCGVQSQCPTSGCSYSGGSCVPFTGCSAYAGITHAACQAISNICTTTGLQCISLGTCKDYTQLGCVVDFQGNYCYWDTQTKTCGNVSDCTHLPTTINTDSACRAIISTCTAGKESGCAVSGDKCSDQQWESACVTNKDQSVKCFWSTDKCVDYTCTNALITLTTFEACQKYKNTCTLNDSKAGCMDYRICSNYTIQEQCQIGVDMNCKWMQEKCVNASCDNATEDYTTDAMCSTFLSVCTVNESGKGCTYKPLSCSDIKFKSQCFKNYSGSQCFWSSTNECKDYSCSNAQVSTVSASTCNSFKNSCTSNSGSTACVEKTCSQAEQESICSLLSSCIWQSSACVSYICASAPTTLTTEEECNSYKAGCTTTGKGCISKGLCADATVEAACTMDSSGNSCIWSSSKCKNLECSDLVKTSHKACNAALKTCTTDGTTCVTLSLCENSSTEASCILGSDGPCLWLNGKCQKYSNCQSITSSDYTICKQIQNQCTSDGTNCIPITLCANTKTTACHFGIDGVCVLNNQTSEGTSRQICEKFEKCSQLNYTTHQDCYQNNSGCTYSKTDNICMDLKSACTDYTDQTACFVSKNGTCFWEDPSCRDIQCTDIKFSTHAQCQTADTRCTTNGNNCVTMTKCSEIKTESSCIIGTDGNCIYDVAAGGVCRLKQCKDYTVDLSVCVKQSGCVSNGSACIDQGNCADYKDETSCANDGTDGVCTWNNSACQQMTACSEANSFETACKKKSDVCKWTPKPSNKGSSSCKAYTCSTKSAGTTCSPLISFTGTSYTVCAENQLVCSEMALADLNSATCFTNSAKTHYWDAANNQCQACSSLSSNTTQVQTVTGEIRLKLVILVIFIIIL